MRRDFLSTVAVDGKKSARIKTWIWVTFLSTIFVQFVGTLFYFVWLNDASIVQPVYALTKMLMLLAPLVLVLYLKLPIEPIRFRKNLGASVVWGIISGCAIAGLIFLVYFAFQETWLPFADNIRNKIADVGIARTYVIAALGISLGHSLFEEYFWRWYTVRGLAVRFSATAAIVLGGFLFALHHYILLSQFFGLWLTILFGTFVGIGGVIWSLIYRRTESLLAPWISHAIVDATLFYIGFLIVSS